jgi:S-adenosyl-L-methionine hydrolase (adenosine-forming)
MPSRFDTISFLSDYGTSDEFVGVVKSVIRSIAPHTTVVDVTHDVRPFDIKGGGLTLARSVQYLCPGVVLAVVDPGVGTNRRGIAIEVGDGQSFLVGPDNGLLASAAGMVGGATGAVELTAPEYQLASPGPTFAGRDVFAPAAAHLCAGVPLDALGPRVDPAELVPGIVPLPRDEGGTIIGEILWVDRYGNCQLNIDPDVVEAWGERVQLRWSRPQEGVRTAVRAAAYGDLAPNQVGLVVDSYGLLSVSLRSGSASETLGIVAGDELTLAPLDDEADDSGPGNGADSPGVTSPVTLQPRRPS